MTPHLCNPAAKLSVVLSKHHPQQQLYTLYFITINRHLNENGFLTLGVRYTVNLDKMLYEKCSSSKLLNEIGVITPFLPSLSHGLPKYPALSGCHIPPIVPTCITVQS